MSKTPKALVAIGFLGWGVFGLFAWETFRGRVEFVVHGNSEAGAEDVSASGLMLEESIATLHADLRALTAALNSMEAPEVVAETATALEPTKRSFLSFRLPSDDFSFDEHRQWKVLSTLSRVGFDGKSTLHDFTGVSTSVTGAFAANLARPSLDLSGRVEFAAASLRTGSEGRNEAMYEHLATEEHGTISFEIVAFETGEVDAESETVSGTATGRMTIRGATRVISMPLKMSIDESRRLLLEGEASSRLSDFDIPIPSKLGVIGMDDEIRIWISLRARPQPRGAQ